MKKYTPMDYDFVYQLKKICYYPYVSEIWGWDEEKQTDYFNAFMENAKENMNIIYSRGKRIGLIVFSYSSPRPGSQVSCRKLVLSESKGQHGFKGIRFPGKDFSPL